MNLSTLEKKGWMWGAAGAAIVGGAGAVGGIWSLGGQSLVSASLGFLFGSSLFGLLVLVLGSMNVKLNHVLRRVNESEETLHELINIRPLVDGSPPLDYGGWAMDPQLGKILAQVISRQRPGWIVECGSGSSTVFMGYCLRRIEGEGKVTAFEHMPEYADKTRALVEAHGVSDCVEVITAPLERRTIDGRDWSWYGVDPHSFSDRTIDLLVVDGPPHTTGTQARYPAIPVLREHLSEDCVIVLDDADRPEEKEVARLWGDELEARVEYRSGGTGTCILRLQ